MSRQRAEYIGLWLMERFTICKFCARYTQTTYDRICRKDWLKQRQHWLEWISSWAGYGE